MATDVVWRGDPVGRIPQLDDATAAKLRVTNSVFGQGVRLQGKVTGSAQIDLPVQIPDKSILRFIQIRAECSKDAGVSAQLISVTPDGVVKQLGSVATAVQGEGVYIQVRSAQLKSPVTVDSSKYSLHFRVTLNRSNPSADPVAYEVVAAPRCNPGTHCPPGPDPEPVSSRRPPIPPKPPIKLPKELIWRGDPVEGIQQFHDNTVTKTRVTESVFGRGLRFQEKVKGSAQVFLPVQIPNGSRLSYLQLRGECSKDAGVAAELISVTPDGAVKVLGSVATAVDQEGTYLQMRSAKLKSAVTGDSTKYSLQVRITLNRKSLSADPVAYEVVVAPSCNPGGPVLCPPGPNSEPISLRRPPPP